jgi:hypothetical protein
MKNSGIFCLSSQVLESISTPAAAAPSHPRQGNLFSGLVACSFLPKKPAIELNLGSQFK